MAAVQSSNMLANYLQDQLQADFAREELVKDGKLTAKKADEQQEEWEQVRRGLISHIFCFGMHLGLEMVMIRGRGDEAKQTKRGVGQTRKQ